MGEYDPDERFAAVRSMETESRQAKEKIEFHAVRLMKLRGLSAEEIESRMHELQPWIGQLVGWGPEIS